MNSNKRILVTLDGSKNSIHALEYAIYLARQFNSTITGLYVIPSFVVSEGPKMLGPYRKQLLKECKKFMAEAKILSAKNGIMFTEKIIDGDVVVQDIVDFAYRRKFGMIIISPRRIGKLKELFLGSVSYGVIHKSKVPVLVVK